MNSTPISGAQHAAPAPDPAPSPAARPRQVPPTMTLDALETAARAFATVSLGRRPVISIAGRTPSALTSAAGYAKASDYAFLKDPRLTLEQKLIRFYALFSKKLDDDIARLKDPSKASSGSSASKSSSSTKKKGLFGKLVKTLGEKLLAPALSKIAGPVLAAGASALGFPMLAPILLKAAPALAGLASEAITSLGSGARPSSASSAGASSSSTGTSSSSSGTSSASSTSGSSDDRVQMLELQQAVDKQKEMFTLVSNMLRSLHDMRMSAIQNIR